MYYYYFEVNVWQKRYCGIDFMMMYGVSESRLLLAARDVYVCIAALSWKNKWLASLYFLLFMLTFREYMEI